MGTEIESNSPGGRDPYTRFRAAMPTTGPLTDAGLEVWPRGMYDLVTQISRECNHPIIEITESGCGYLDGPNEEENGRIPDGRRIQWYGEVLAELARVIADGARVRAFHAWTITSLWPPNARSLRSSPMRTPGRLRLGWNESVASAGE